MAHDTMLLMCDECAFVWTRPDEVEASHAVDPLLPEFARRVPGVTLSDSHWATPDEVLGFGWGQFITALNVTPRDDADDSVPSQAAEPPPNN